LRVVFAGTPPFAARALEALLEADHDIALVITRPDRPAGRGLHLSSSAVSLAAAQRGLPTYKPPSLKGDEALETVRACGADVMVVAAYGLLLPPALLSIPTRGCLNIHASLLPRWRGAAPIPRALLAGDAQTGICIMQMDSGLDTGPVLLTAPLAIGPRDSTESLTQSLASLGAQAIVAALASLDSFSPRPQESSGATYAAKITKAEARIDWMLPATIVDRQVRAFNPVPGAESLLANGVLKVWAAEPVAGSGKPGEVLRADAEFVVACGDGALALRKVQRAGGKPMPANDFLRGFRIAPGEMLEAAECR
jgi:methionyl-tRNA formyltransferase